MLNRKLQFGCNYVSRNLVIVLEILQQELIRSKRLKQKTKWTYLVSTSMFVLAMSKHRSKQMTTRVIVRNEFLATKRPLILAAAPLDSRLSVTWSQWRGRVTSLLRSCTYLKLFGNFFLELLILHEKIHSEILFRSTKPSVGCLTVALRAGRLRVCVQWATDEGGGN